MPNTFDEISYCLAVNEAKRYTDEHSGGSQYPPDNKSIKVTSGKIEVNGYNAATLGYILVKTSTGVGWIPPVSEETLDAKVAQAGLYATQAGNSAAQADASKTAINNRIMFFDSFEEYQEACKSGIVIDNYTVSFILQDTIVGAA